MKFWIVIPLLLIGIIGIQESFADDPCFSSSSPIPCNVDAIPKTLPPLDDIQMLEQSSMVFSGKLTAKEPSLSVENSYILNFEVTENFKFVFTENVTVHVNENVWKYCKDLKKDFEYVIFIKENSMSCHYAIPLPDNSVVELRNFSSQFPEWGPLDIQVSVDVVNGELLNYYQRVKTGIITLNLDMETDGHVIITIPKTTWHLADSDCNLKSPTIFDITAFATFTEEITDDNRIITIDAKKETSTLDIIPAHNPSPFANAVTYGKFCFELENNNYLSPNEQLALGFGVHQVICKNDALSLAIKSNSKSSVCIKDESVSRLLDRGYISTLVPPNQSDLYKEQCESEFGTWYETLHECAEITPESCHNLGGSFDMCDNLRYSDGRTAYGQACVAVCSLGLH